MKTLLTLLGSPKNNGNTAKMLSLVEERLAGRFAIETVTVSKMNIKGCLGCYACQGEMDIPGCIQKDDAAEIFQKMMAADAVLYASPLYCWGFTGQIKALIDRHFCLVKGYGGAEFKSLIDRKPIALLVTCAGPVAENADLIQIAFDRLGEFFKARVVGKYPVPFCTSPEDIGENGGNAIAQKMADDLIKI